MKPQTEHIEKRPKTVKVATLISVILALAILLTGSLGLYWAFTGKDVIQLKTDPVPVKPKFVKSNEKVTLTVGFCKIADSTGVITQSFVSDKSRILTPSRPEPTPKGCYDDLPLEVAIPPELESGKYHINYRIVYNTNPLHREVVEEINSEQFEVLR